MEGEAPGAQDVVSSRKEFATVIERFGIFRAGHLPYESRYEGRTDRAR